MARINAKKRVAIIATSIVVVGGVFVLSSYKKPESKVLSFNQTTQSEAEKAFKALTEKDIDADGLKDWEESLWKSDPGNPDTDGDGTNDSEEVKAGRNPTIKGPNDSLSSNPLDDKRENFKNDERLSVTEKFSRDVFSRYMSLKQMGAPVSLEEQLIIANSVAEDYENPIYSKQYKVSDIRIGNVDSKEAAKIYGNTIGNILKTYGVQSRNEGVIVKEALEQDNRAILKELDPIISSYEQYLTQFLLAEAPPAISKVHLNLINTQSRLNSIVKSMRLMFNDPLLSLAGIKDYQLITLDYYNTLTDIQNYLRSNGVSYGEGEGGYVLLKDR